MNWIQRLMKSSLGAKYVMALTGAGLFAFVVGHVAGNLLLYFGQDAMNNYAVGLRNLPYGLLWIARAGILVIFVLHVASALRLTMANRAARPTPYHFQATVQASYASRTMPVTGIIVLLFVLYHLAPIPSEQSTMQDRTSTHRVAMMSIQWLSSGFSNHSLLVSTYW